MSCIYNYWIEGDDLECDEEDEQACDTCPIYLEKREHS